MAVDDWQEGVTTHEADLGCYDRNAADRITSFMKKNMNFMQNE
ncbi:hypothetical protein [Butyrivibrio sp. FC2001]|nr:hypothetical protein [Butyrivibrio sp. FC2001]